MSTTTKHTPTAAKDKPELKTPQFLQSMIAKRRRLLHAEADATRKYNGRIGDIDAVLAAAATKAAADKIKLSASFHEELAEIHIAIADLDAEVGINTLVRRLNAMVPTTSQPKLASAVPTKSKVTPKAKPAKAVTPVTPKAAVTKPKHEAKSDEAPSAKRPGMQALLIEIMKTKTGPQKVGDLCADLAKKLPDRTMEQIKNQASVTLTTQAHVFHKVPDQRGFYVLAS